MNDTKVIARKVIIKDTDDVYFQLEDGVLRDEIPSGLFVNNKSETWEKVILFFENRVFPKERCGADYLLEEMGLNTYDPWIIAKKTRGTLMTDPWWMKLKDSDTYETCSLRGMCGIVPFHWDEIPYTMDFE